jgi:hypothetical protein
MFLTENAIWATFAYQLFGGTSHCRNPKGRNMYLNFRESQKSQGKFCFVGSLYGLTV